MEFKLEFENRYKPLIYIYPIQMDLHNESSQGVAENIDLWL